LQSEQLRPPCASFPCRIEYGQTQAGIERKRLEVRNDKQSEGTFEALHQPLLRDRRSTKLPETPSDGKKNNEKEERR